MVTHNVFYVPISIRYRFSFFFLESILIQLQYITKIKK